MSDYRFERAIEERLEDANRKFRVGQVTAIVSGRLTVIVDGVSLTIPRLSTWTPAVNDIVLIATTNVGWIVLGKILP